MRATSLLLCLSALGSWTSGVRAQEDSAQVEEHKYTSDISRLRSIVIHSLYSQKDVFLRELISNSNDALEKLRLISLREKGVMDLLNEGGGWTGNVTIEARPNEDGTPGGKLIVRDTGIGMTKDELATNLGTIAKSGTADFLKAASSGSAGAVDSSNLIGQFGLGAYSIYLVTDHATISSLPPPTPENPYPEQYSFESSAGGDAFTIMKDPRGKTLGPCGTEIVLDISEEGEKEGWLDVEKLKGLVEKHSQFATTYPIYILEPASKTKADPAEDIEDEDEPAEETPEAEWKRLNEKGPIWMRDPKEVTEADYTTFYQAITKEPAAEPLGQSHFKSETSSGVAFRAIMYIPSKLADDFFHNVAATAGNIRLMVKRVFITDDLGDSFLPRWLSFLKIVIDADDLPLNVSRETLQNTKFLKQLQRILQRKALDLFSKIAADEPENYRQVSKVYGNALRVGLIESDSKDKTKIAGLLRFESTTREFLSLDEYVTQRKGNQKQIFYFASVGESAKNMARSPFVEKLQARGYEVLLLNQPADESAMTSLKNYQGMTIQDVSKKGLKFGDEEEDAEEKSEFEIQKKAFKPLIAWLKEDLKDQISDVVLTNRLVTSPCTVVADSYGWSANMAKIMAAQMKEDDPMQKMFANAPKLLELNPKSPLILGLLEAVIELPSREEGEEPSLEELEVRDTVRVLLDTTMVRSGFTVGDVNEYFDRVESLLRRSLGVSLAAKGSVPVKPAPAVATGPLPEIPEEDPMQSFGMPGMPGEGAPDAEFVDWQKLKAKMATEGQGDNVEDLINAVREEAPGHDEL